MTKEKIVEILNRHLYAKAGWSFDGIHDAADSVDAKVGGVDKAAEAVLEEMRKELTP